MLDFNKVIIVLRGVSGSGKSSVAEYLAELYRIGSDGKSGDSTQRCVVCTADDYFLVNGEYKFDFTKLGQAHAQCLSKFEKALIDKIELVIVANTNTKESEINPYIKLARASGYTVLSLVVENRHANKSIHSVPEETLTKQAENLKNSLKLR